MIEITVKEISERLADRAEELCNLLIPGGKIVSGEYVCGDLTGGPGESLKVQLQGPHTGQWRDWATDEHGDMLDLWRHAKWCAPADAIKETAAWLGITLPYLRSQGSRVWEPCKESKSIAPLDPNGAALAYLHKFRSIKLEIIKAFQVAGDREREAIVFPCYSPKGTLVNRSYRTITEPKRVWQDKGCGPCLFGWHAVPEAAYVNKTILLCEGQIDAMTWSGWGVPALSIPNGSGQTWIDAEWENLEAFSTILISFDMDGPGKKNAEAVIKRLGEHRCKIVTLPYKDANQCLLEGYGAENAKDWIDTAAYPMMEGVLGKEEWLKLALEENQPQPVVFTPNILRHGYDGGYYARPGEVTVWTGVTGHGKSTFLNYLMMRYLTEGHGVLISSLEVKVGKIINRMISGSVGHKPTDQDMVEFSERHGGYLSFIDEVGYIDREKLLQYMMFAFRRFGISHVLVDSLMRVDGLEEDYVAQGKFMNELQAFAKTTGVHVHLVAHPRKIGDDGKPGKMDIKGSSLIANNADNIVTICMNLEKEKLRRDGDLTDTQSKSMYDAEIRVEKQRETGWTGRSLLMFDPHNFTYSKLGNAVHEQGKII